MTFWQLIRRNLSYHARAHLGVVLGAAIGSAAVRSFVDIPVFSFLYDHGLPFPPFK